MPFLHCCCWRLNIPWLFASTLLFSFVLMCDSKKGAQWDPLRCLQNGQLVCIFNCNNECKCFIYLHSCWFCISLHLLFFCFLPTGTDIGTNHPSNQKALGAALHWGCLVASLKWLGVKMIAFLLSMTCHLLVYSNLWHCCWKTDSFLLDSVTCGIDLSG